MGQKCDWGDDNIWDLLDHKIGETLKVPIVIADATVEVQLYASISYIIRTNDELEYEARHQTNYPYHFNLAFQCLAISATSVPHERIFCLNSADCDVEADDEVM